MYFHPETNVCLFQGWIYYHANTLDTGGSSNIEHENNKDETISNS